MTWRNVLQKASLLSAPQKEDESIQNYNSRIDVSLALFQKLTRDESLSADDWVETVLVFWEKFRYQAEDAINRVRDGLIFYRNRATPEHITLEERSIEQLKALVGNSQIDSHQRLYICVALFNMGYIDICYDLLEIVAEDDKCESRDRIEACRFIYVSEGKKETVESVVMSITSDSSHPSEERYRIVASFSNSRGIDSTLNQKRIRVDIDREFAKSLQTDFFYNASNGVRERILAGQYLIQHSPEDVQGVIEELLEISRTETNSENCRADAADVVLRLGDNTQKMVARDIITAIGDGDNKQRTIYSNSQNVHNFAAQIDRFIENIILQTEGIIPEYENVKEEVVTAINTLSPSRKDRYSAMKALNRIEVDSARFTKYKATLPEIFVHVWLRIMNSEYCEDLKLRFVEELIDMSDTCSSGHSGRFINVLSSYDDSLQISWEDQIVANISGRMNKEMRDIADEELKGKIFIGMSDLGDEGDKVVYTSFVEKKLSEIKKVMYGEFVTEGYITEKEFEDSFTKGVEMW